MGHLFIVGMLVCAVVSLAYPWVGVLYGYLFVVLTPQDVWYWDFSGWRAEFWVLLPTCIGVVLGLLRGSFDLSILRNRRNLFLLILWMCFILSYFLGPFTDAGGPYRFDDPTAILERIDKMLLFYFLACLCIDTEGKAKLLFLVFVASSVYLTYWANEQYLTGHYFGRLSGPTAPGSPGIYADQNSFAMLFVVAQSFLWYLGSSCKRAIWRWSCWLAIPFSWNAVFLTGSRGGFLGLAVVILLIALRSKRKLLGLALIPAFILVFYREGGVVMTQRVDSIGQYHKDTSAQDRLESWRAAERMIAAHPLTGVGLASFGPAYPYYSKAHPREAHDTFLQITAESGVLAGAMYVLIVGALVVSLWQNGKVLKRENPDAHPDILLAINEATLIGFTGLVVCSIFLSLENFEIFYCLNVLGTAVLYLSRSRRTGLESAPAIAAQATT